MKREEMTSDTKVARMATQRSKAVRSSTLARKEDAGNLDNAHSTLRTLVCRGFRV